MAKKKNQDDSSHLKYITLQEAHGTLTNAVIRILK